jgi:hypothetical protein
LYNTPIFLGLSMHVELVEHKYQGEFKNFTWRVLW